MNQKKILVSFLLVVLIALSVGSVAAEDAAADVVSADAADVDVVAADDSVGSVAAEDAAADVVSEDVASDSPVAAKNIQPAANTFEAVKAAIDSANETDTIDLSNFAEYDFTNNTLAITKDNIILSGNGSTIIKGHGANAEGRGNGLVYVTSANVTVQGIHFIDTHPANNFTYNGTVKGYGVKFQYATSAGGVVTGCNFTDFASAVAVQASSDILIENSYFNGGYTTIIANDPTINVETGSKSLNVYGGSSRITVRGNTFEGQILDGVSIAQGSGSNIVEDNIFIGNTYSIYFGGASTVNSLIRNNTFINCGYFHEGNITWEKLPVISIQKASNDIAIENNTFYAINNNVLIAAEQSNEAHGFPSSLGNINVTGNTVIKYTDDVYGKTVVLFHVLCRNGTTLNLTAPLKVENNNLDEGIREYVVWYTAWGNESDIIIPVYPTAKEVQAAIDAAINPGDVVDLSYYDVFDFNSSGVTITNSNIILRGNGSTVIKGYGKGNGLVYVTGSNVTVEGIHFVDTNPDNNFTYNGTVSGYAVKFRFATSAGGVVTGCNFTDFATGVAVQASSDILIENSYFNGGYTTIIANDPTVNVEKGSKSLNIYGGSSRITVRGNTFEGQILDGVSIAQGSGSNIVENNIFIGNTYSIYFGGASTVNSLIRNNTFINCGYFKEGDIIWTELPVISIQKASNDIAIVDNTFYALNNTILIAAEQGNEAHGFPSSLGNINVTGNTVKLANENISANTVVLFNIFCRNGNLNLSNPINVTGNVLADGVKTVSLQTSGDNYFDIEKNATPVVKPIATILTVKNVSVLAGNTGKLTITLTDADGKAIEGQLLAVEIDGETYALPTTDANGAATVNVKFASSGTRYAYVSFIDTTGKYIGSLDTAKITVSKKTTSLKAKKATLKVKKAKKISVTLKSGKTLLKNKKVTIKVNGKTFKAKTNSKGVAKIKVKVTKKGKFTATVKFAGDSAYKAVTKKIKLTVKK